MDYQLTLALAAGGALAVALLLSWHKQRRLRRGIEQLASDLERHRQDLASAGGGEADPVLRRLRRLISEMIEGQEVHLRNAAHEIRTPLTRALLALELGKEAEMRKQAAAEIARINELVEEMIERARLLTPQLQLEREDVDLHTLLAELIERDFDKHPAFALAQDGQQLSCRGDRRLLQRCLRCILDNALKYSELADDSITIALEQRAEEAVIRIADRGPHLPAEQCDRVFEPFVRLGPGDGKPAGTGLGLAIAEAVARAHQGRISCSSPPGGGLVFELELPINGS